MKIMLKQQAWLVLTAGVLFLSFLGSYALFNDVEPINAGTAAEMFRLDNWIVPTFNEQLSANSPILIDWCLLISYRLFGISEWSARVTSSLFAIGTTLLTYHLGRKLYSYNVGLLAGLILSTCLLFTINGRSVTPDSLGMFFVTFSIASYVWFVARQREGHFSGVLKFPTPDELPTTATPGVRQLPTLPQTNVSQLKLAHWWATIPMFMATGLAVLTMGVVGFILPIVTLLAFLLLSHWKSDLEQAVIVAPKGPWWKTGPRTLGQIFRPKSVLASIRDIRLTQGLVMTVLIALPWYLAVGYATNGLWPQLFFLHHPLTKSMPSTEGRAWFSLHSLYLLYQLVSVHAGCFPWSVFLPVALYRLRLRLDDRAHAFDSDLLLTCWIGTWFVYYTLFGMNVVNELLPMYPAVALILARYLNDWQFDKVDMWIYSFLLCCRAMWIVGAVMTLGIYVAAFLYFPGEQWLGIVGLVPVVGAIVAIKLVEQELRQHALRTLIGTSILLAFLIVGVAAPRMSQYQDTPLFVAEARQRAKSADIEIATFRYFEPTVVFYVGKPVQMLGSARQVADFIASHRHGFVLTKGTDLNDLREELRGNVSELSRHRNFLHGRDLILLGRE